jgi:PAS domain S-box-containing protein
VLALALLIWARSINEQQQEDYALADALMDLQIVTAVAHLWFEEAITTDDFLAMKDALSDIDKAVALSEAILSGGASEHGLVLEPLKNPLLRQRVEEIIGLLRQFKSIALRRYREPRLGKIGSLLDRQFNEIFREFQGKSKMMELLVEKNQLDGQAKARRLFGGMFISWSLLLALVTAALWSRELKRERAEEALRESEGRYRALVETSPDAIIVHRDGRFLYANPAALRLYGSAGFEKLEDKNILDRIHPDDRGRVMAQVKQAADGEKAPLQEARVIGLDGQQVYIEATAGPVNYKGVSAVQTIAHDITERKRGERALRESDERLRVAISGSPITVYQHDKELRFTWVYNPPPGLLAGEILGRKIEDVYIPEDAARLIRLKREVIDRGVGMHGETWLTISGEPRFLDFSVEPLRDGSGQITGVTCATIDVTDHKRAEEALRQRTAELQQLNETLEQRVRERTAELANLSSELLVTHEKEKRQISYDLHDKIWQTLEIIKFDIECLFSERDEVDWEDFHRTSKQVVSAIQDAVAKIRSIQGDLWPSVLDDVGILATIEWYCREFGKNHSGLSIEKHVDLAEEDVPPSMKVVIYRVMQEAMNNVAKHSQASHVFLSLIKKENLLEFTVKDNGIGFDLEEIIVKRHPWGGLGLLSMKERTELSGGLFGVESGRNKGTTVRASWPC